MTPEILVLIFCGAVAVLVVAVVLLPFVIKEDRDAGKE